MERNSVMLGNKINQDNHIKLSDPSVSRKHAKLQLNSRENYLVVEDCQSKYGTFVNQRPIRKKRIGPNDIITFGHTTYTGEELMKEVRKFIYKNKVSWQAEFNMLEMEFIAYEKQKKKIRRAHSSQKVIIQIGLVAVIFMLTGTIANSLEIAPSNRTIIVISSSLLAGVFAGYFVPQEKVQKKLKELEAEYEEILTCPNYICDMSLKKHDFNYWKKKRKCPNCKASWVVE